MQLIYGGVYHILKPLESVAISSVLGLVLPHSRPKKSLCHYSVVQGLTPYMSSTHATL